jgi:hypothetical protein
MNDSVAKARNALRNAICDVLEETLRKECGIIPNEKQREKLYDFVQFELNT